MPLKSRRILPPGGFIYFQPQTNWSVPSPMLDFDSVVKEIIRHREANPRWKWSTDFNEVANELDAFTCVRIANNPQYCTGTSASFPKAPVLPRKTPGLLQSARNVADASRKVAAGVGVLIDWLGSGAKPVDTDLATKRAEICAGCPKNKQGDLTSWFTVPASNLIRKQLEVRKDMNLSTKFDSYLGVCEACACPMKLKVFVPLADILKRLLPESKDALDTRCWMLKEGK